MLLHESADPDTAVTAIVRGAFEYQGQKCSAASRLFVPRRQWPGLRDRLVAAVDEIPVGDVSDFSNFMGAVIDARAFTRLRDAIAEAEASPTARVVAGGGTDDAVGWFVQPTIVETDDPGFRLLRDELFGPVLTVLPYDDWDEVLTTIDTGSPYALTGAVLARDRAAIAQASDRLRNAAGNFYVNDKPTGAVVGQQPFGGGRASGTNDKAGSLWNLARWTSPRAIKETFAPPTGWRYPHMG
jgi:1-pyrroline-5-carboxylate dehydrogenase